MTDDTPGPFDLDLTRSLNARPAALWRCWTEPDLLEQWFCPRPWRATDVVIDLRPGGAFATTIRGPEGEVFENEAGCWLEVTPHRRLVWTSALGPGWRPLLQPDGGFAMTAIITMEPAPEGGTHKAPACGMPMPRGATATQRWAFMTAGVRPPRNSTRLP